VSAPSIAHAAAKEAAAKLASAPRTAPVHYAPAVHAPDDPIAAAVGHAASEAQVVHEEREAVVAQERAAAAAEAAAQAAVPYDVVRDFEAHFEAYHAVFGLASEPGGQLARIGRLHAGLEKYGQQRG
jgi:hypothetical protein